MLSATLLAACGSSSDGSSGNATTTPATSTAAPTAHAPVNSPQDLAILDTITVTQDDPAKTPTVKIASPPVNVSATTVKVLKEGSGEASNGTSRVTVRQALFLGSDGKQLDTNYEPQTSASFVLNSTDNIPGLNIALFGVKAGSRILYAIPPADAFGAAGRTAAGIGGTDDLVVVADILSVGTPLAAATGTPVAPVAGLPTVTFDPTSGPTITVPKTAAPTALVSQLLVEGTGPVVASGQSVTVHYTGVLWDGGTVFDSSWAKKAPFTTTIGTGSVIPAWDKAIVGQKVGSRVLIIAPPADAYGTASQGAVPANATLVFVVDILDAG